MNYSRRQLYALGEPIGESATRLKLGGRIYGGGGGGGGSSSPDKTTQVTELPEWARPYAKDTLAKGAALTDINQNPYQTYGANRIAGFSPMQQQAQQGAANMQPSQQLGTASDMAQAAGIGALGANYQAGRFSNQFRDPGQYQPGQFSMSEAQAPNLQNYQFENAPRDIQTRPYDAPTMQGQQTGYNPNLQSFQMDPAERVRTRSFAQPGSAEAYMSPYMQNVVDIQKREAQRQSGIQGTQQQAQAAQAGAFGGSRDAIMRAERERNLSQQMGDIQAQGSQAAYQQAQQQFNQEQQARLSAQQANQQAGLTVGGQNLNAQQQANVQNAANQLQASGMNAQQAMQAALANQQAGLTTGSQNLAANLGVQQLGAGQIGLQTSLANLNNQQQAAVQNQAAQLQTQGMNAQQALQAALANQQAGMNTGQFNATNAYNTALQNAQMRQQSGLSNQALQGQYGLQQGQFQQAANAQNAQQGLQAALANQQTRYNVGAQNLAANLGVQQLGSGQNMQAQLANQQALQQAQNAAEQSRQFGSGQGLQAANLAAQYGQSAQQLGEQSRQYGAGLGMQGLQTALQSAGQLGQLGGQQFQQGMDINKLQSAYGGQQQQQAQRYLDQNYQDFQSQQNNPYKQLGFMSDMIRGLPLGQQSTSQIYSQGPGTVQTLAGLGGAAYGFGKSGLFGKEGGLMTSYAEGGGVTSQDNKDSIVEGMYSMEALQKAKQAALARRDVDTAEAIDERIAELNAIKAQSASIDRGLGSAFDQIPEERQETMMAANGGIVAFAPGGATYGKRFEESLDTLTGMQQPKTQTPEELEQGAMSRLPMLQRMMGPDVTEPFAQELKAEREKLPAQMEKDQGLAIAMASLGLLARKKTKGESQSQQLISGLGEAGQQFAGEVSRIKKENREADNKIRQSQLLIATAQQQRKEGMAGKALASQEKAGDQIQDAFKTKVAIQKDAAQLLNTAAGNQLQADTSRYATDTSAKVQREVMNKPSELRDFVNEYEKRVGKKLTAQEFEQAVVKFGEARGGYRYSGPDKTFENDAKFQKDLTDRTEILRLQKSMPGKTQAEIEVIDRQIEAERQKLIEEYRQTRASGVTSKATPSASPASNAPPNQSPLYVTAPDGKTYRFNTQAEADKFRKQIGG